MKSLFLEKIMDTDWLIKQSTSGYKLYRNINMLAMTLHDTIVYEDSNMKIDAFIYYDYLLYLSE
ncbi:MAG: hypothetical protein HG453_000890 [Clostridiales bacterium]|nr:hypothetical protein [Clostridiales bacterium]